MKETTKKLLESNNPEDFVIGLEVLYREEGMKYFRGLDDGPDWKPQRIVKERSGFSIHPGLNSSIKSRFKVPIACFFIEDMFMIVLDETFMICKSTEKIHTGNWSKNLMLECIAHEINPIYPW